MTRFSWFSAAPVAAVFVFACGSSPKPVAQIASSEGAIRGATEAGAQSVPAATLYLQLAQESRDKALRLVEKDKNQEASGLLLRSEADAELALAIARAEKAKHDANSATERVEDLKESVKP